MKFKVFNEATNKARVDQRHHRGHDGVDTSLVFDLGVPQNSKLKKYDGITCHSQDVVAQVQPPLLESEVTPMFVETLTGPFYDHMLNHATKDFADMVLNGEFILTSIRTNVHCIRK
ncbi:hypothetical protein GQ457_04G012460 [Hibiscus cannabinus]